MTLNVGDWSITGFVAALGLAGIIVLVAGLALGLVNVVTGPTAESSATGPGIPPTDCAQTWSGCPQTTPRS